MLKVVVLGPPGVGKTTLLRKYALGRADADLTFGVDFSTCSRVFEDRQKHCLMLYELAGSSIYSPVLKADLFSGADACLIVVDRQDQQQLIIAEDCLKELKMYTRRQRPVPSLIVSNKIDLPPCIPDDALMAFVDAYRAWDVAGWCRTNARTGDGTVYIDDFLQKVVSAKRISRALRAAEQAAAAAAASPISAAAAAAPAAGPSPGVVLTASP